MEMLTGSDLANELGARGPLPIEEAVDYLVKKHFLEAGRPFRNCQPRDLLLQVRNRCFYANRPLELTCEHFDDAVENYFAMM